jgi:hypothetical protein
MDLLYFLDARLRFIEQLYDSAVRPFEETQRMIREQEPPYVDRRDPEGGYDEPPFLREYQEASDSVLVLGHWCLCMVQATLQAYLRECVGTRGSVGWNANRLQQELAKKKGGNWFGRYRLLFLEDLGIDWNEGPIALADLEQLNLTRDDLIHNMEMFSANVERCGDHVERFPKGLFADDLWMGLGLDRVNVDKAGLQLATRLVRDFCAWLDGIRCRYPEHIRKKAQ